MEARSISATRSEPRLRSTRRAASVRRVALTIILLGAVFLAIGAVFDSATDAAGKLPADHGATFKAVTSLTWQQATAVAHPVTPYVTRTEAGYAAYELLFGVLLLVVAAIPLRRGERWAWWCCWLPVLAFAAFATLFGVHNPADLWAAIVAGLLVALALIALVPTARAGEPVAPAEPHLAGAAATRADGETEP
jgi:hypothetical protein